MILNGIKYMRKYWRFSLLMAMVVATLSCFFLKKNDYKSMIFPVTVMVNQQLVKTHGFVLTHHQNSKKNLFLMESNQDFSPGKVITIHDVKNKKNYPVEIVGFFNGYYGAILDEVSWKKINYSYGPINYKNTLNFVTLSPHQKPITFRDKIKNIIYSKKPLGLVTFIIQSNKIAGLMVFDQKSQKVKAMAIKTFINQIKLKEKSQEKALDLVIFNKTHLKVMTTNKQSFTGQLIKVDGHSVNSMEQTQEILKKIQNNSVKVTIKSMDSIEKTMDVAIIDQWITHQEGHSRYLHQDKNYSYYFYHPLAIILKINHKPQEEIFIINTNGKLYKQLKNKGLLKVDTINNEKIATLNDFLKAIDKDNFSMTVQDDYRGSFQLNFIMDNKNFFKLDNMVPLSMKDTDEAPENLKKKNTNKSLDNGVNGPRKKDIKTIKSKK